MKTGKPEITKTSARTALNEAVRPKRCTALLPNRVRHYECDTTNEAVGTDANSGERKGGV